MKQENSTHGRLVIFPILLRMVWTVERLNELYYKNLLRLLKESGLSKSKFADKVGIGADYLSQMIRDKDPVSIGKETLIKFCNAFNVGPRYFDMDDNEPQPLTIREQKAVYQVREAERIGEDIAEQMEFQMEVVIESAKKKGSQRDKEAHPKERFMKTAAELEKYYKKDKKKKSA